MPERSHFEPPGDFFGEPETGTASERSAKRKKGPSRLAPDPSSHGIVATSCSSPSSSVLRTHTVCQSTPGIGDRVA